MIVKGVIFDLDQTLVDTHELESFRDKRMWNYVYRALDRTYVYPKIYELIDYLKNEGIKISVVTSSKKEYAVRLLRHHGLEVDVLVAYSDTRYHKPSPDPMLKALSLMSMGADEVINVGDRENDVIAGKVAGIYSILIGDYSSEANLVVKDTQSLTVKIQDFIKKFDKRIG